MVIRSRAFGYIEFYGAAWDGEGARVEPLALGLDLATHLKERNTGHTMASSFDAFVLAIENIQVHYGSIEAEANQAHPQYDPHIFRKLADIRS